MTGLVIIPSYKPDEKLISLVNKVWDLGNEVIVVDDGSGERYHEIFEKVSDIGIVIHHKENRGKGAAIKTAFKYIEKEFWNLDVVGIMDADGQHLPEDMEKLLIKANTHRMTMVLGVREIGKAMPLKSRVGNAVTRRLFQRISGVWISDTQTGLRAFDPKLISRMRAVAGERYEYETNVLLSLIRDGVPIEEVKIHTIYHDRDNSCSHFRIVKDSFLIYKSVLKFTLSSFSSFVLDYLLFALGTIMFAAMPYGVELANVLARIISGYYNYHMNTRHVFHVKKNVKTAAEYFALAAGILLCNSIILEFYRSAFLLSPYIAKLLTEITLFVISFAVQKKVIFRKE